MCVLHYHCRLYIFASIPACVYSEPLKAIILFVYPVMKGQTVTDGPVFRWTSSMLLVRYCSTLSSCFSDGKTFHFARPAPESPSITMSTIDHVVLSSPLIKSMCALLERENLLPMPFLCGVVAGGRTPLSPPCFRPNRLFLSRGTLRF